MATGTRSERSQRRVIRPLTTAVLLLLLTSRALRYNTGLKFNAQLDSTVLFCCSLQKVVPDRSIIGKQTLIDFAGILSSLDSDYYLLHTMTAANSRISIDLGSDDRITSISFVDKACRGYVSWLHLSCARASRSSWLCPRARKTGAQDYRSTLFQASQPPTLHNPSFGIDDNGLTIQIKLIHSAFSPNSYVGPTDQLLALGR